MFSGAYSQIFVHPQLSRWPPLAPRHVRSPAPTSLTLPRATDLARPQTSSLRVGSTQAPDHSEHSSGSTSCNGLFVSLHRALWAVFLLGFFTFFRKSNIIPPSHSQFSPTKHLSRSDFHFTSWGLIVSVKWSKVIQFRERTLLIPLVSIPSHALCPVHALRDFFDTCQAPASSPAFVLPTATGLRSISYSSFTKHLKDLLRLAGLKPDNYSGHSFRRGGATYASSLGIPHELIQLQGDWASTAYLEYLARPLRQRLSLAQRVASQLGSSPSPT